MNEAEPDAVMGGRLRLHQPRRGHRAGTDAILLAAAAASVPASDFVDVGAGVGTAGLALAVLVPASRGVLLEQDAALARYASDNCRLNLVEARVRVAAANLFDAVGRREAGLLPERAGLVLTNPPFYAPESVRHSPDPGRAAAHVLTETGHGAWVRAAVALLAPKGWFVMIHRPEALPALVGALEGRLGGLGLRPIVPREGEAAMRVLLSGIKGSRAPLRILPELRLHGADGGFTAEAEAIHRGERLIGL